MCWATVLEENCNRNSNDGRDVFIFAIRGGYQRMEFLERRLRVRYVLRFAHGVEGAASRMV